MATVMRICRIRPTFSERSVADAKLYCLITEALSVNNLDLRRVVAQLRLGRSGTRCNYVAMAIQNPDYTPISWSRNVSE